MSTPYDLTRTDWGARNRNRAPTPINPNGRPGIEGHHSVGRYGANNPAAFAREVQRDHLSRNWVDAFYNVGIWMDGTVFELRGVENQSGAITHLTICYPGNYNNQDITLDQKLATLRVREWLLSQNPNATDITYHGARDDVDCPGRSVIQWYDLGLPSPNDDDGEEMTSEDREMLKDLHQKVSDIHSAMGDRRFGDDLRRLRLDARLKSVKDGIPVQYEDVPEQSPV